MFDCLSPRGEGDFFNAANEAALIAISVELVIEVGEHIAAAFVHAVDKCCNLVKTIARCERQIAGRSRSLHPCVPANPAAPRCEHTCVKVFEDRPRQEVVREGEPITL
ncbi:hypothetical protein A9O63_13025 [Cereibacter johrii]|nr:hypothetical protein A9O63_13025 [Cereibacter johrii]